MRILILDLKWSYGIEEVTAIVSAELRKSCEVTIISAVESKLPGTIKLARSRTHKEMLTAFLNPLIYVRLLRAVRRSRPDVVYIVSPHVLNVSVILLLRALTGVYLVSHIHDPEHYGKGVASRVANAVCAVQARLSHRVYCWGEVIKSVISSRFSVPNVRIAVFRHPPGQLTTYDRRGEPLDRKPLYLSMVGALEDRKGIDVFLKAADLFNQGHGVNGVRFLLAGSGDLTKYKALIAQLPNLEVHNRFVDDEEVNEFLLNSYALCLPYVGGCMQSSFVAIAYGNGCPVIVSRNGSMHEEVTPGVTGYVTEKNDAHQLAEAMRRVVAEPHGDEFSGNCLRYYRDRFLWSNIVGQMFEDMTRCSGHTGN